MRFPLRCMLLFLGVSVLAGKGPAYRYGDAWWQEYQSDGDTELLIHVGNALVAGHEQVRQKLEEKKTEAELIDLDEINETAAPALGGIATMEPGGPPPLDESAFPANLVGDHSRHRRRLELPRGMSKAVGEGRFGDGLRATGGPGLEVRLEAPEVVECAFKIDALPAATVCLLSVADDESRVLLHPDGRLEFKLAKPHGNPGEGSRPTPLTDIEKELILAKEATIIGDAPIAVGEWVHVAVWSMAHPTPGGGEPWDARLTVNGTDVDWYLSERYNPYSFFGRGQVRFVVGNSARGDQGFTGLLDEIRVSTRDRNLYERPPMPWRDAAATRPLQFDRPFFRADGTVFHASLDRGTALDRGDGQIGLELRGTSPDGLRVDGIRGHGWVIDSAVGFPRFPLTGIGSQEGSVEFWLRPVNWDDVTGYWQHSPPDHLFLSVARFYGKDRETGETVLYMSAALPRAHNIERGRTPLDPGHWDHWTMTWRNGNARLHRNGRGYDRLRLTRGVDLARIEPLYVEFGIPDEVTVQRGQRPLIEIDEVVGYNYALAEDEMAQARQRWMGALEPIPLYRDRLEFKWSLQKLEYSLTPLLPEGQTPATCTIRLFRGDEAVGEPREVMLDDNRFFAVLHAGTTLPEGDYLVRFAVRDAVGKPLVEGERAWHYEEEPWRHSRAGILDTTPAPWTPIAVDGTALVTRMTRYTLGGDGLPTQILADGEPLLTGPFVFLEDGQPLIGKLDQMPVARDDEADWQATFAGKTLDLVMACHAEYDGMLKLTLTVKPKAAKVAPLAMVVPHRTDRASHALWYPMGARGVHSKVLATSDGTLLSSRDVFKGNYGFFGHLDLNDRNRGLWWFCDNAAGWVQSKEVGAIAVERAGATTALRLNLIAEPAAYASDRPIVFAFLPHPARPMPADYRRYERTVPGSGQPPLIVFDAFRPWPQDPRSNAMKLYPAADPKNPDAGPSWAYAESCIPSMKAAMPVGLRTMYLSKAWFSCRAGEYDHWEWRSGDSSAVSLTPSFVNYLCWEMNEWIGRGIWDAIYLDECYEHPARNLEAGFSVLLPDGTEQPGVTNFAFRELMKRWRGIFIQHGKEPVLIGHHTYSWQYHGLLYCDAYLDGENRPIVSLRSRDWVDSTAKAAFETVQNGALWGMASFYMPFIAEGGFDNKSKSEFPRWQWRMARQAQSEFAHYEVATVYEGQGSQVYKAYWNDVLGWGAADPAAVTFHPYWNNDRYLRLDGQGDQQLVSFYRRPDGAILLVASNATNAQATQRIELNADALGLDLAKVTVRDLDSGTKPPPGDDFRTDEKVEAPKLTLEDDEPAFELLGPGEKAEREAAAMQPKLEGKTLVLPVQPKDFRLIAIEPK